MSRIYEFWLSSYECQPLPVLTQAELLVKGDQIASMLMLRRCGMLLLFMQSPDGTVPHEHWRLRRL